MTISGMVDIFSREMTEHTRCRVKVRKRGTIGQIMKDGDAR